MTGRHNTEGATMQKKLASREVGRNRV